MVFRPGRPRFDYAEYVRLEALSTVKHEFLAGEIYAMAGGSPEHSALGTELTALLVTALRGGTCRVYNSDLRVLVLETGLATYPDLSVVCGPIETSPEDRHAVTNPTVLVEVTSPSTEAYDRGEKREHYQQIASLREYVLVSHRERLVEVWRREEGGWLRHEARRGRSARLESIGCAIDVDSLYDAAGV